MGEIKRFPSSLRFGIFEIDPQARELRRHGLKVKLQEQPFQVLAMLLERPGEVVTREELQKELWAADTFVDFERGLNRAINKLREALVDDAESPHFIETLPRRGYRFLAPVEAPGPRAIESPGPSAVAEMSPGPREVDDAFPVAASPGRRVLPWLIAGAVVLAAGLVAWKPWRTPGVVADRPILHLDLDVGSDEFSQPTISPDGMRVAFVSKGGLAVRRLDQTKLTRLTGTEGAAYPFFSSNGQWVAFFAARKLHKIAVDGGAPIALCEAPSANGGTWGDDDTIIASINGRLARLALTGGMPQPVTDSKSDPSGTLMQRWPQALPGGKGVLFAAVNGSWEGSLQILTPRDGKVKALVANSTYGRYLPTGHLVYYQRGTLFAAPMDATRFELTGPAVPLDYPVSKSADRADFDVSASGTLVYRPGAPGTIAWLSSSGTTELVVARPGTYLTPRLSPDGKRLAVAILQEAKQNIWVYDLSRETWTRLTFGDDPELLPTWTPDGEFLAFRSGNSLAWTRSDGSGKVERLPGVSPNSGPWTFSPDGKWLAFWPLQPGSDLFAAPVERAPGVLRLGRPLPLLERTGSKGCPAISPDGRWLAYTSDESGRFEVYVVPLLPQGNAGNRKWLVSNRGGWSPIWSQNGRELFYQTFDRQVHVAAYAVHQDSFAPDKPRAWTEKRLGDTGFLHGYDVAPDGKRVLALLPAEDPRSQTFLRVLLNVDSELRRRAPVRVK